MRSTLATIITGILTVIMNYVTHFNTIITLLISIGTLILIIVRVAESYLKHKNAIDNWFNKVKRLFKKKSK